MEMEVSSSLQIVSVHSVNSLPSSPVYIPPDEEEQGGRSFTIECRSRSLPSSGFTSPPKLRGLSYDSLNEVCNRELKNKWERT